MKGESANSQSLCFDRSCNRRRRRLKHFLVLIFWLGGVVHGAGANAQAEGVDLTWDEVVDSRLDHYTVHYRASNGSSGTQPSTTTSATIANLEFDTTYSFVVTACPEDETLCSGPSNEVQATLTVGPPDVTVVTPADDSTAVNTTTTVAATFGESLSEATIDETTFQLRAGGSNGALVAATVEYDTKLRKATLTPNLELNKDTLYTAILKGGDGGIADLAGNAMTADVGWSFTTASQKDVACPVACTVWSDTDKPAVASAADPNAVELGVKFRSAIDGYITGIRFYKGPNNTGTHVGNLWTGGGTLLATATFVGETASGWQQVEFDQPVAIKADTLYVASYHAPNGGYASNQDYFASSGVDNAPLHFYSSAEGVGNGVYRYGSGGFPDQTWNASNYWVDVIFRDSAEPPGDPPGDTVPPTVISTVPTSGALGVATAAALTAAFSEAIDPATLASSTFQLRDAVGNLIPAALSYDDNLWTATLTPDAQLAAGVTYTAAVNGVTDLAGNVLTAEVAWSFTTVAPEPAEPPQAAFWSDVFSGPAPLEVTFFDDSAGSIETYSWDFGDNSSSNASNPVHIYQRDGRYDVSLTVSGKAGSDTITKTSYILVGQSAFPIEVGEVGVDHEPTRVDFEQWFDDPVVVINPLSSNGDQPAVVRVESVDNEGFSVRIQEWAYLDGWHTVETVSYLVVERGRHQLPDQSWIEAGTIDISGADGYKPVGFEAAFESAPVVFSSIVTAYDASAYEPGVLTTRMRNIDSYGFELALQTEEAVTWEPGPETVAYVAWAVSSGELNGMQFEVGRTGDDVTDAPALVRFSSSFGTAPTLVADMQTADGGDTANLRWRNKSPSSVELWVDEEQSRDSETTHTTEVVGYLAMGKPFVERPLTIEAGEVSATHEWQRVEFKRQFTDPVVTAKLRTANDFDPAVVRVDGVDGNGFSVRVQEWDYLDGERLVAERIAYLVVERGRYRVTEDSWIEAGHVETSRIDDLENGQYVAMRFGASFGEVPVVLTTVASAFEAEAVTTRQRNVTTEGFEFKLQEQEANAQKHSSERIDYLAWEPSAGEIEGLLFEVGRTGDMITHKPTVIPYTVPFDDVPLVLGDMQRTDGGDTASVRCDEGDAASVGVWIEEEQSKDTETNHTSEDVGYLVLMPPPDVAPGASGLAAAYAFDEGSGMDVIDSSPLSNDGGLAGAIRVEGRFGGGLQFDGQDDWVTIEDDDSLDLTDGLTLEAWVKPSAGSGGWSSVLLKEGGSGLSYALYADSDVGQPVSSVRIGSDHNLYGGSALPADVWTHLAATYDGVTQRLFINGEEVATRPLSGALETSNLPLRIGGNGSWLDEFFSGVIDEVRIYGRALGEAEIQADMVTPIAP